MKACVSGGKISQPSIVFGGMSETFVSRAFVTFEYSVFFFVLFSYTCTLTSSISISWHCAQSCHSERYIILCICYIQYVYHVYNYLQWS